MLNQALQGTIRRAIETRDFSSLYDCFADDVELKIAMGAAGSPVSDERCKRCAIDCLRKLGEGDSRPDDDEAPEFFANGERIVAFWDESVPLRSGVAIRCQSTLVFDVRGGFITRLAIHHDLSFARTCRPDPRVRPPVPVVEHAQRNHAA